MKKTDPFKSGLSSEATTLHLGSRDDGGIALALVRDGAATEISLDVKQVETLCHALVSNLARALAAAAAENGQN